MGFRWYRKTTTKTPHAFYVNESSRFVGSTSKCGKVDRILEAPHPTRSAINRCRVCVRLVVRSQESEKARLARLRRENRQRRRRHGTA